MNSLERALEAMHKLQMEFGPAGVPGIHPQTSGEMKARADNRRYIATQLKIQGKEVRPEYE